MSLLILFLMMTSAVALSRIILGEVKMVINTTNSLSAYYAADSAIEKGLYYIKYARKNRGAWPSDAGHLSTDPFNALAFNEFEIVDSVDNHYADFYYREASTASAGFTAYNINTSTPAHVDIIDPSGALPALIDWDSSTSPSYVHSYFISWSIEDCFPFHASDKLEITQYTLGASNASTEKKIIVCDCAYDSDDNCSDTLTSYDITDDKYYRFVFRPLDGEVQSLSFNIYAYDTKVNYDPHDPLTYDIVGIASNASLIAEGIFKNARYSLQVDVPSFGAVSNIFSYVIFSEEELKKDL